MSNEAADTLAGAIVTLAGALEYGLVAVAVAVAAIPAAALVVLFCGLRIHKEKL